MAKLTRDEGDVGTPAMSNDGRASAASRSRAPRGGMTLRDPCGECASGASSIAHPWLMTARVGGSTELGSRRHDGLSEHLLQHLACPLGLLGVVEEVCIDAEGDVARSVAELS